MVKVETKVLFKQYFNYFINYTAQINKMGVDKFEYGTPKT